MYFQKFLTTFKDIQCVCRCKCNLEEIPVIPVTVISSECADQKKKISDSKAVDIDSCDIFIDPSMWVCVVTM